MKQAKSSLSWNWTPSLKVGVQAIDEDHKKLFQLYHEVLLMSQADNYCVSTLYGLAHELLLYTKSHFKREEAVMIAAAFPLAKEHFAVHRIFIDRVQQLFDDVLEEKDSITEFVGVLRELFITHIKENDQHISSHTKGADRSIEQALTKAGPLTLPQPINIYIVDDDPLQVEMLSEIIDVAGFSSLPFTSAALFIEHSINNSDIVLLDLNMPEIDGIEVIRTLYNKGCTPTYMLISGFDERVLHSSKQFAEAKKIDVAETFTKPFNTRDFMDKITSLHARKKLELDKTTYHDYPNSSLTKESPFSLDELKAALKKRQLVLFYQPQINLKTGEVHGVEALVRIQHPERGLVFPDQFIELAEKNNLISGLTDEVFKLAIQDYEIFQKQGEKYKISINISTQDLLDLTIPERLSSQLQRSNIPTDSIMIELTESALMSSVSDSLDILNRLRMKGFSLSIDDFGTGYSSLVQLYQAPFTEIKIDLHFVMRMMDDPEARAIVKMCILLAKELKMETVAEGVENQIIFDELKGLGCDFAQGYHISKPLPIDDYCQWIQTYQKDTYAY